MMLLGMILAAGLVQAAEEPNWLEPGLTSQPAPVVVARTVPKRLRFQLKLDSFLAERRDLYINWGFALSGRFFFAEEHGVETQFNWQDNILTDTAERVQTQTGFRVDTKPARWQWGAAYVWAPVYGKYAFGGQSLIHFDLYFLAGGGIRFPLTGELQPFAQLGLGMNHFIGWNRLSLVPEYRVRFYSEKRTNDTFVVESLVSLGVAWLF
jgi:outer membrane beta-barrel protein